MTRYEVVEVLTSVVQRDTDWRPVSVESSEDQITMVLRRGNGPGNVR